MGKYVCWVSAALVLVGWIVWNYTAEDRSSPVMQYIGRAVPSILIMLGLVMYFNEKNAKARLQRSNEEVSKLPARH